jgi:hypothetical protein
MRFKRSNREYRKNIWGLLISNPTAAPGGQQRYLIMQRVLHFGRLQVVHSPWLIADRHDLQQALPDLFRSASYGVDGY